MNHFLIDRIDSDLGQLLLVTDGVNLCALDFADYESRLLELLDKRFGSVVLTPHTNPQGFSARVSDYLAGNLDCLQSIPIRTGGTPFQQQVWSALRSIPAGTAITYAELAQRVGKPTAYRAVGTANGQNPIVIVLPCHRVIGANAQLTGYSGGLERKRWLLQHEGVKLAGDRASHPPKQLFLAIE